MAHGMQILTQEGMRDITLSNIPRKVQQVTISGLSGTFTLPAGSDENNTAILGWNGALDYHIINNLVTWRNPGVATQPSVTVYIFRF